MKDNKPHDANPILLSTFQTICYAHEAFLNGPNDDGLTFFVPLWMKKGRGG